jgi:hypothetical protein
LKALLILFLCISFIFPQDLSQVRDKYYYASKTKESAQEFYEMLSDYKKNNQTLIAYKGAAIVLKSKYTTILKNKKSLFIEGVTLIENAVKNNPDNCEIRLIRLSIQENTPKFLKYNGNIETDKKHILSHFDKLDVDTKNCIRKYVQQSKLFSDKELSLINN